MRDHDLRHFTIKYIHKCTYVCGVIRAVNLFTLKFSTNFFAAMMCECDASCQCNWYDVSGIAFQFKFPCIRHEIRISNRRSAKEMTCTFGCIVKNT